MTQFTLAAAIIAVVEAIKQAVPQVSGWITICVAGVLGLLAGIAGLEGTNWIQGLMIGLAAAGGVKLTTSVGGDAKN